MADFDSAPPVMVKDPWFTINMKCVATYGPTGDIPVYSNAITGLAKKIRARVNSAHQVVVVIFGGTGTGKSTFCLQLIKALDKDFKLDDVYIYDQTDLANKIDKGIDQRINWYDEGSVTLNSLETTSKKGRSFSKFFDTMRFEGWISLICIPDSFEIQKRILKHVDFLIECPDSAPIWGFYNKGFFNVLERTIHKSGKVWDDTICTGIFKQVPKKLRTEYEAIKKAHAERFKRKFVEEVLS